MTETPDEFCFNCRYWSADDDEVFSGDCRRHSPRLAGMAAPHGNATFQDPRAAMWPATSRDDWCGEHLKPAHAD
jgi:hypothetical protein